MAQAHAPSHAHLPARSGGGWFSVFKAAAIDWWEDNCMRLAASLSYYTALSLAPLLVLVISLAGLVLGREAVSGRVGDQIESLIGPEGAEVVRTIIQKANEEPSHGRIAAVVGIATLVFGATAVFGELQAAMNLIWEVKPKPTSGIGGALWQWFRQRFLSLTMVLVIAFLLLVSLAFSAALTAVTDRIRGGDEAAGVLGHALNLAVSIPVITLLFALLFRYVPDGKVRWRDVWVGALVSAVLFTLGKFAIGVYLGKAGVGSAYGAAGSLIVVLVWVYYSSLILFYGAEFTQAWAVSRGGGIEPKKYAEHGAAPQTKSEAR